MNDEGGFTVANPTRDRNRGIPQPQPLLAPNWFLGLVPREFWNVLKTFFVYEADFVPIAGGATASVNTQIQQDSHFLCVAGVALVTTSDNLTLIKGYNLSSAAQKLVQVTDVGSGMPVSSVPLPVDNLFGWAESPAVWPLPKLFRRGGAIQTTLTNLNGGTAHNVRLSYWGIRIYPDIPAERAAA
jgi:hypothetical protein